MVRGLIVLRDLAPYGTAPDTWIGPAVPASWDMHPEAGDWYSIWPQGREENPGLFFHAWKALDDGAQGVFAVIASDAILRALRDSSARTWTIHELRTDTSPAAVQIRDAWRDERPHLYQVEADGTITDLGPDPAYSPIGIYRRGMAGWAHAEDVEATTEQPA